MAPPALDPWSNVVASGSNDFKLYGMAEVGGTQAFTPYVTGGMIQSRPAVVPATFRTPSSAVKVAYVTSADGYAYAINTATGALVWKSVLLTATTSGTIQGGAGVWLQAVVPFTFTGGFTGDVVLVGTSDTSTSIANKVYALNGATGAIIWTFNPGNMDIISSAPYPDYVNAVWVTSKSKTNSQPSVWKLNAATGALLASWSKVQAGTALGDVDSAPNGSFDGSVIYVGTNGGTINAIKTGGAYTGADPAGSIVTYTPVSTAPCNCTGAGTVKMPYWLTFNTIGAGTPDTIVFSRTATVHSVNFNGTTFSANWTVTPTGAPAGISGPVDDGGTPDRLYVGGSDGKVHQLDASTGTDQKQIPVAATTPTLGEPTFNVDTNAIYIGATNGNIYTLPVPFQ
jgi:outer membrane protein assembly factor BamB